MLTYAFLAAALMALSTGVSYGQKYPERRHIRQGNREYADGDYNKSEVDYRRALEKDSSSHLARFNLGAALYKQESYEEASKAFMNLAKDESFAENAAACHYNAGNTLVKQRKLREALEEYKNSLRRNPADMDAKFNLAYVKKLLEEEEQQGGGGDDDDQKKDDQNQNQDKNDGDGQQDKNDDKQNDGEDKKDGGDDKDKDKDRDKQPQEPQEQEGQSEQEQRPAGMKPEEALQLLEAIQAQEDKTREKLDENKKAIVTRGTKNW